MAQCTAPKNGHRTARGRANCPVCGNRYGGMRYAGIPYGGANYGFEVIFDWNADPYI